MFLESDGSKASGALGDVFDEVHVVPNIGIEPGLQHAVEWVTAHRFDAIFYPEVGMHAVSILMAALRLATVQVTSYGHSASTHGAEIDYFIGGSEVEQWTQHHPVSFP